MGKKNLVEIAILQQKLFLYLSETTLNSIVIIALLPLLES